MASSTRSNSTASSFQLPHSRKLEDSSRPDFIYKLPTSSNTDKLRKIYTHNNIQNDAVIPLITNGEKRLTILNYIEMTFCLIFLFIPRIIIVIFCLIALNILGYLGTIGLDRSKNPVKPDILGIRLLILHFQVLFYRIMLFAVGVLYIEKTGKKASVLSAPISVVAPHKTLVDTAFIANLSGFHITSPISNDEVGVLLNPLRLLTPILVSRTNMKSRKFVVEEMNKRVTESKQGWNQLLVFPEGTTGNGSCLMNFKPGAFIPGCNIQPIYLQVSSNIDLISCTWVGPTMLQVLLLQLLCFRVKYKVHYLPIYTPNDQEKLDPHLYAYNLRKLFSIYSELNVIDVCYEDGRLMDHFSKKYKGNMLAAMPNAQYLFKNFHIRYREMKHCLDDFMHIFGRKVNLETGQISLKNFSKIIKINENLLLQNYFQNLELISESGENIILGSDLSSNSNSSNTKIEISIKVILEAYFRARDNVSISKIEELNIDKIVEITNNRELYNPDIMFDFLMLNPYYLACIKED